MYNALSKAVNDLEMERRDVMMDDFMLCSSKAQNNCTSCLDSLSTQSNLYAASLILIVTRNSISL